MTTQLAPREQQYVNCIRRNLSDKEIAREMGISPGTVQGTGRRVRYKLQAANRIEVLIKALQANIIELCLIAAITAQAVSPDNSIIRTAPRPARSSRSTRTRGSRHGHSAGGRLLGATLLPADYLDTLQTYDLAAIPHPIQIATAQPLGDGSTVFTLEQEVNS